MRINKARAGYPQLVVLTPVRVLKPLDEERAFEVENLSQGKTMVMTAPNRFGAIKKIWKDNGEKPFEGTAIHYGDYIMRGIELKEVVEGEPFYGRGILVEIDRDNRHKGTIAFPYYDGAGRRQVKRFTIYLIDEPIKRKMLGKFVEVEGKTIYYSNQKTVFYADRMAVRPEKPRFSVKALMPLGRRRKKDAG